jgi:hypothetical protein
MSQTHFSFGAEAAKSRCSRSRACSIAVALPVEFLGGHCSLSPFLWLAICLPRSRVYGR